MTKWTKTKRLTALGVALAVATSMLIGPAAAVDHPTTRTEIIDAINSVIPTVSEDADKKLSEAAKKLTESLNGKYWSGDELSKEGTKVFEKDRDAVKKLREAIKKLTEAGGPEAAAVNTILNALVLADEKLVTDMIAAAEAAKASASKIADAEKELAKAHEELLKDKPHEAIDHFKKAWEKAFKAEEEATKDAGTASGNGGGSYSEYTFMFIEWQLDGAKPFSVYGTNRAGEFGYTGQGNEGWLQVEDEKMQLHVSCSDAFTDGTGDKSDPTVDSRFRVVSAHIAKYKDGVLDKECDINGGMAEFGSIDLDKDFSLDGSPWLPGDVTEPLTGSEVSYRFTITNTGNVELSNIFLTDEWYPTEVATCFAGVTLLAGDTAECTIGSFVAVDGLNYNVATVTATAAATAETVTDTDVAQFFSGPPDG